MIKHPLHFCMPILWARYLHNSKSTKEIQRRKRFHWQGYLYKLLLHVQIFRISRLIIQELPDLEKGNNYTTLCHFDVHFIHEIIKQVLHVVYATEYNSWKLIKRINKNSFSPSLELKLTDFSKHHCNWNYWQKIYCFDKLIYK